MVKLISLNVLLSKRIKGRGWMGREHLGVLLQEAWVHDETVIEALNHDFSPFLVNKRRGKGECGIE